MKNTALNATSRMIIQNHLVAAQKKIVAVFLAETQKKSITVSGNLP